MSFRVGVLVSLLSHPEDSLRIAAIQALTQSGQAQDTNAIRPLIYDRSLQVRKEVCLSLGRLKDKWALEDLLELMYEEDAGLKRNAHWALKEISHQPMAPDPALWEGWWERSGKAWVELDESSR